MKNLLVLLFTIVASNLLISQSTEDDRQIRQIVKDMADAWTAGSGEGFVAHFAEEHDFFVWNGLYSPFANREQNAKSHQQIFNTIYKDTQHYAVVDKIKFVADDVAVLHTMSAVVKKGEPKPEFPQVLWMAVLKKENGKWSIVSFHNADLEILDNAESMANSPIPPQVMYKNWFSEAN